MGRESWGNLKANGRTPAAQIGSNKKRHVVRCWIFWGPWTREIDAVTTRVVQIEV